MLSIWKSSAQLEKPNRITYAQVTEKTDQKHVKLDISLKGVLQIIAIPSASIAANPMLVAVVLFVGHFVNNFFCYVDLSL